ncbi:MAG: hypothetical protein U9N59_03695 [Campylobacterota bacterium]|nr:hypothetical protein [Campylobacterota bacterium]
MNTNRYKTSSCSDKRSIVRALNTFSKQYNFIICNKLKIDLNIESMTLQYEDKSTSDNIIYSKSEADISLKNTKTIIEAINNLISINRKKELKESLIKAVEDRQFEDNSKSNPFFTSSIISKHQIVEIVDNEDFAIRLYNQIKNRIIFDRAGIYSKNGSQSTIKNKIKTNPTNISDILDTELDFVLNNLWLFDNETIEKVDDINSEMDDEISHEHYNDEYAPNEDNTSYFHPIDEVEYNDPDATYESRRSQMTEAMLQQEDHGLYDQELHFEYNSLVATYEEDTSLVIHYIEILLSYAEIESTLEQELSDINDYALYDFNEYKDETVEYKKTQLKNKLLFEYEKTSSLNEYLEFEPIIKKIQIKKPLFENILKKYNGDDYIEYEDGYEPIEVKITTKEQFERLVNIQQELLAIFEVNNITKLRNIPVYILSEAYASGYIPINTEEELLFIVKQFDINSEDYQDFL